MRHVHSFWLRRTLLLAGMSALALFGGCARQPPEKGFLSGVRMHVIMTFRSSISPNYYYFFLINNSLASGYDADTSKEAPGPIPIFFTPPPGTIANSNGFATGSGADISGPNIGKNTGGFTDFVLYTNNTTSFRTNPANNFSLERVLPGMDANDYRNIRPNGAPTSYVPITTSDTNPDVNSNRIEFEIDLAQLIRDAAGQPISDALEAYSRVKQIEYLQVNMIATNAIPTDQQTAPDKETDAMGPTQPTSSNSFFTIRLTNGGVVQSANYSSSSYTNINNSPLDEPSTNDVVPNGSAYPGLDLLSWEIDITDTNQH